MMVGVEESPRDANVFMPRGVARDEHWSKRYPTQICFQLKFHERARFSMTEIQSQNRSSLLLWLTNTEIYCLQSQVPFWILVLYI